MPFRSVMVACELPHIFRYLDGSRPQRAEKGSGNILALSLSDAQKQRISDQRLS